MYAFLLVIHVIVSLFLIFIILIQSGKGEGLSDVFGGGSSQTTIFGSRTGNFLTKATTASAIIFMVTCLSLALISKRSGGSIVQQELLKEQTVEKVQQMLGDKEAASEEAASEEAASEEAASEEVTPEEVASEEAASEEVASEEVTSEEAAEVPDESSL